MVHYVILTLVPTLPKGYQYVAHVSWNNEMKQTPIIIALDPMNLHKDGNDGYHYTLYEAQRSFFISSAVEINGIQVLTKIYPTSSSYSVSSIPIEKNLYQGISWNYPIEKERPNYFFLKDDEHYEHCGQSLFDSDSFKISMCDSITHYSICGSRNGEKNSAISLFTFSSAKKEKSNGNFTL